MVHTSAGIPFSVAFQLSVSLWSRTSFTTLYVAGAALFVACARNFAAGCQAIAKRAMGASHRSLRNRVLFMVSPSNYLDGPKILAVSIKISARPRHLAEPDRGASSQVHNLSSMIF